MDYVFLFKAHNGLPNCLNIFIQNFALQNFVEFWEFIHNFHPVTFPNRKSRTLSFCSMNENLSFIKTNIKCTNDGI
jgi:hypothetical protein